MTEVEVKNHVSLARYYVLSALKEVQQIPDNGDNKIAEILANAERELRKIKMNLDEVKL